MAMLASTMTMGSMTTAEPSCCTISTNCTVLLSSATLNGGADSAGSPGSTRPERHQNVTSLKRKKISSGQVLMFNLIGEIDVAIYR